MLGSGGMARTFLEAFKCVRDIRLCKVYSPSPQRREDYAAEMSGRLGIEVRPVDDAREAVRGVDLLSSCTNSMRPVYDADWIEKGMHVTNLGRREVPDAAIDLFDVVVRQGTAGLQMRQTERRWMGLRTGAGERQGSLHPDRMVPAGRPRLTRASGGVYSARCSR